MHIEQFVMAYHAEQDRLRALLPEGFRSIRPVLRINAEIQDNTSSYLELVTAVEHDGQKGWLNIGCWLDVPFTKEGKTTTFHPDFLTIAFTGIGLPGSCPAEKDNAGCWFLSDAVQLRKAETITSNKEFCDCSFRWHFTPQDAHGESIGKTLPALPTEPQTQYPPLECTPENAAAIPCDQVLGCYIVNFER